MSQFGWYDVSDEFAKSPQVFSHCRVLFLFIDPVVVEFIVNLETNKIQA